MLTVKIIGFGCYKEERVFSFKRGVTLLHGDTGCGKSTVFKAIDWCLYGKLRGVYNAGSQTTKVAVEFGEAGTSDWISVTRTRGRNKLTITAGGIVEIGEAAQSLVDKTFGTKDSWSSSSYVVQGERNVLFTLSKIDKGKTLTWCEGIKPAAVVAALKQGERSRVSDYENSQLHLTSEYTICERFGIPVSRSHVVDISRFEQIPDIRAIEEQLSDLNRRQGVANEILRSIASVDSTYKESKMRFDNCSKSISRVLDDCSLNTSGVFQELEQFSRINELKKRLEFIVLFSDNKMMMERYDITDDVFKNWEERLPFSDSSLRQLQDGEKLWNSYISLINDFSVFKRFIQEPSEALKSSTTIDEYVKIYNQSREYNMYVDCLTILTPKCYSKLNQVLELIELLESVKDKPVMNRLTQNLKSICDLSPRILNLMVNMIDSVKIVLNSPSSEMLRLSMSNPSCFFNQELFTKWEVRECYKDLFSKLMIGYIPKCHRDQAVKSYRFMHDNDRVEKLCNDHKPLDEQSVLKIDALNREKYIEIVGDFMSSHTHNSPEMPSILSEDYTGQDVLVIAQSLRFLKSYEMISGELTLTQEQYDRLMLINHIDHCLSQLRVDEHSIREFEEKLKTLPYICEECGYQSNGVNDVDITGSSNITHAMYTRYKSLTEQRTELHVTDEDRKLLATGVSNLSLAVERTKKLETLKDELRMKTETLSSYPQDFLDLVSKGVDSIGYDRYVRDVDVWSKLIAKLQEGGFELHHTNADGLMYIKLRHLYLKQKEDLDKSETVQWLGTLDSCKYTCEEHLNNDVSVSNMMDRMKRVDGADCHPEFIDDSDSIGNEHIAIFKRIKNLGGASVKQIKEISEAWEMLSSHGITYENIVSFSRLIQHHTVYEIAIAIEEGEKYERELKEWQKGVSDVTSQIRNTEDISGEININERIKQLPKMKSEVEILKKIESLKQSSRLILNRNEMEETLVSRFNSLCSGNAMCSSLKKPQIDTAFALTLNAIHNLKERMLHVILSRPIGEIVIDNDSRLKCLKSNIENLVQLFTYYNSEKQTIDKSIERKVHLESTLDANYKQFGQQIEDVSNYLKAVKDAKHRQECLRKVHEKQQVVISTSQEAEEHMKLRIKIEMLKNRFDLQFINQLNLEIERIVNRLFATDFHLTVYSVKETKTTGNQKHEIGFNITTNGRETDIRGISGGEADRVSLALTIALANIWNTRFIMIDESMKSLDDETRRNCLGVLRETGKVCVCISHSDIVGMYDHELCLSNQ